jgi:apolipoprotein N-acyltransferase
MSELTSSQPAPGIGAGLSASVERMARLFRGWVAARLRRRPALVLALAGALSVLAMAPFHAWPILFLTLPVLFWSLEDAVDRPASSGRIKSALWRGWAFGFGFHAAGLFWIGSAFLVQPERFALIMPFAIAGLAAGLALFHGVATSATAMVFQVVASPVRRIAVLAAALMASEWLRGNILTGFPWNTLGQALTWPLPLMQASGLIGIYGLTALAVIVLATPAVAAAALASRTWVAVGLSTLLPLAGLFAYGWLKLAATPTVYEADVRLRLVQPSIPQRDKFDYTKRRWIFDRHLELSAMPAKPATDTPWKPGPPTHVIWPEAAIPFFYRREPAASAAIAAALPGTSALIAGTFRLNVDPTIPNHEVKSYRIYNTAVAVGGDGRLLALYDKLHLVPFGEYLPAPGLLNALGLENLTRTRGGMKSGRGPRPILDIPGLPPLEMLICYEAIFPEEIAVGPARPELLVNLTNDAWFGLTTGPYQHLHQARLRAVEQGLPLVRSANNGISAVVDPVGRIKASMALNDAGVLDHGLPRATTRPPYGRWGAWIEAAILVLLLGWIVPGCRLSRRDLPN